MAALGAKSQPPRRGTPVRKTNELDKGSKFRPRPKKKVDCRSVELEGEHRLSWGVWQSGVHSNPELP